MAILIFLHVPVIRVRRSQCGVPQLALRAYSDDRLEDRGGALLPFVERGYPHKTYHHHPHLSINMDMGMVMMPKKGVPRDGAMGGSVGSPKATKGDADASSAPSTLLQIHPLLLP
jgi:hypothetical protein